MELDQAIGLTQSVSISERLEGLKAIRAALDEPQRNSNEVFSLAVIEVARRLLGDSDNDCRWQAGIVIGQFIDSHPTEVWDVITEIGPCADDDMLDLLGTVLLEHLLEKHFEAFIEQLETRINAGDLWLRSVLLRCWRFDQSDEQWSRIDKLQRKKSRESGLID